MQKGQNDCKILRSKEPVKDIIRGKKSAEKQYGLSLETEDANPYIVK